MVMVGPGRSVGPQRGAGCTALLFEGEGQLCDIVPGTSTADSEPQASLSAPAWGEVSSSFLAGEMGRGLYIFGLGLPGEQSAQPEGRRPRSYPVTHLAGDSAVHGERKGNISLRANPAVLEALSHFCSMGPSSGRECALSQTDMNEGDC